MITECNLPEQFNAADYFVDRHIREGRGNKLAVVCEDRKLTCEQIRFGMNQVGNALAASGIKMEDRVALMLLDTAFSPRRFWVPLKWARFPFASIRKCAPRIIFIASTTVEPAC